MKNLLMRLLFIYITLSLFIHCQNNTAQEAQGSADSPFDLQTDSAETEWPGGNYIKQTEEVHQYPLAAGKALHQFFADEGYLYFLFDGRFSIYNKQYLEKRRTRFDMQWYAREKKRYESVMDSLGLQQAQSFSKYVEKSRWLEGQFEPFLAIHPVQEHLRLAHNIWEYEPFRDTFADALATQEIAPGLLEHNFFTLLRRLANDGKIERVLFLDSLYRDTHEKALGSNSPLFRMYSFGINELRTLQSTRDSLKNVAESEERYYFQEAVLFLGICRTGWLGEGYCDQTLGLSRLEAFVQQYPESQFRDDAEFHIIEIKSRDWENGMIESPGGYLGFLESFPESNKKVGALMALLEYYSERNMKKEGLEIAGRIKKEFPEAAKSAEYESYVGVLGRQ